MAEIDKHPNLRSNGKRRWVKRLGLTNPELRADQLWLEDQNRANEALTPPPPHKKGEPVLNDLPLDAGDRAQETLQSLLKPEEKKD